MVIIHLNFIILKFITLLPHVTNHHNDSQLFFTLLRIHFNDVTLIKLFFTSFASANSTATYIYYTSISNNSTILSIYLKQNNKTNITNVYQLYIIDILNLNSQTFEYSTNLPRHCYASLIYILQLFGSITSTIKINLYFYYQPIITSKTTPRDTRVTSGLILPSNRIPFNFYRLYVILASFCYYFSFSTVFGRFGSVSHIHTLHSYHSEPNQYLSNSIHSSLSFAHLYVIKRLY